MNSPAIPVTPVWVIPELTGGQRSRSVGSQQLPAELQPCARLVLAQLLCKGPKHQWKNPVKKIKYMFFLPQAFK